MTQLLESNGDPGAIRTRDPQLMLTTIAPTMIPEAVHLAGSGARVGLATLVLVAISFKLLE